jgi:hypothetical protein
MSTIYYDSDIDDESRRKLLYEGNLFVYSPVSNSLKFCEFAREMITEAFKPLDPLKAQYSLPVEKYVEILAELKPKFIHHADSKKLIQQILKEVGCDLVKTYFDVPRMRSSTHGHYLTSGIAYAFHPHRDTWYSAPMCQINWWIPIFPVSADNIMAFHPRYFGQGVRNGSRDYNYYRWNEESRKNAAQHIKSDTRKQPRAEEPIEIDPQIRIVTKPGGILMFSAAQLHSTVPNTSGRARFSIDFRTIQIEDAASLRGARNVDSECSGTTMRDFLCANDLTRIPERIVAQYDQESSKNGTLVYVSDVLSHH